MTILIDIVPPDGAIIVPEQGGCWPTIAVTEDWDAAYWLLDVNGHIHTGGPGVASYCFMRLGDALDIDDVDDDDVVHVLR